MEDQMFQLKNDFENVKNIVDKIAEIKTAIKKKLGQLKEIHTDLIKTNDSKKIFLICLESFHFQYKAMIFDSDNLQRNFLLLSNRAFCDYTSLYGLLQKMFEDYKIDIPTATVHPVYNDLDPYCEYKMEDINLAHDNSVELIMCLICKLRENENTVSKYKVKSKSGIRIANFINTLEYDNNILRDQIELYINYCDFFQSTQHKYFNKLLEKIKALQHDIDEDIMFHETQCPIDEDEIDGDEIDEDPVDGDPADGDQTGSQWTTNPLILTHPVHYDPSGSKDPVSKDPVSKDPVSKDPVSKDPSGSEPKDPSGSEPKDPSGSEPKDPSGSEPKDPSGSEPKDPSGSEPKDLTGANPLTDMNWGIAFEELGKEDEDKEEDESKSPINKKKNKKNKK